MICMQNLKTSKFYYFERTYELKERPSTINVKERNELLSTTLVHNDVLCTKNPSAYKLHNLVKLNSVLNFRLHFYFPFKVFAINALAATIVKMVWCVNMKIQIVQLVWPSLCQLKLKSVCVIMITAISRI